MNIGMIVGDFVGTILGIHDSALPLTPVGYRISNMDVAAVPVLSHVSHVNKHTSLVHHHVEKLNFTKAHCTWRRGKVATVQTSHNHDMQETCPKGIHVPQADKGNCMAGLDQNLNDLKHEAGFDFKHKAKPSAFHASGLTFATTLWHLNYLVPLQQQQQYLGLSPLKFVCGQGPLTIQAIDN